jgi:hypothetical protein
MWFCKTNGIQFVLQDVLCLAFAILQFSFLFAEPNPEFDSYLQGPVPTAVNTTVVTLQANPSPVVPVSSSGEC